MPAAIPSTARPLLRRAVLSLAAAYAALLLVLWVVQRAVPVRAGPLGMAQILAPYLFLPLVPLAAVVLWLRGRAAAVLLVVTLLVGVASYLPLPARGGTRPAASAQLGLLTWNVYTSSRDYRELVTEAQRRGASVVVLQEADWRRLDSDQRLRAAFPYRLYKPRDKVPFGMALFSTHPILEHGAVTEPKGVWDQPRVLWARLDLGGGRSVLVVNAHPVNGFARARTELSPVRRDAQLGALNRLAAQLRDRADGVVVLGDMNVTDREPAYRELTDGLRDVSREAGSRTPTWRPPRLARISVLPPLLRIDYVLTSAQLVPLSSATTCVTSSDHCLLSAEVAVPGAGAR